MMERPSKRQDLSFDLAVVGGGYAGTFAAIAAARELRLLTAEQPPSVVLIQERSILGGCASSEIRVPPIGAGRHPWAFETGLVHEFMLEERRRNHTRWEYGTANSIVDLVLWEMVSSESNLTLLLNSTVRDVTTGTPAADGRATISAIHASQLGTEKELNIQARYFIDATGDGTVGFKAGADYQIGREGVQDYEESFAPPEADDACMGSTILFKAVDTGHPVAFEPPAYAPIYPDEASLVGRPMADFRSGYWWIEVGHPFHTLDDNEAIRDELLRYVLGIWDHVKNRNPRFTAQAANWALDWFGWVPGKRETRRLMGDYVLTETDLTTGNLFEDRIAYGGHFLDLHTIGGILAKDKPGNPVDVDPELWDRMRVSPYSIPFRSLYSRDIANLLMAGRDLSATHIAMGSTRVMLTNAVIGQGVGTAAAHCVAGDRTPRELAKESIGAVQQSLLRQGCYLPRLHNADPADIARVARASASSSATLFGHRRTSPAVQGEQSSRRRSMEHALGEIFPVSGTHIDRVSLYVESDLDEPALIDARLRHVEDVWSASKPGKDLSRAAVTVPPLHRGFVTLEFAATVEAGQLYMVYTEPLPGLFVRYDTNLPTGVVSLWQRSPGRRWLYADEGYRQPFQSYWMDVEPAPMPYGPENILTGQTRPERWTNCWVSDPSQEMPQWLDLAWDHPVRVRRVELTFDTNLSMTNEQMLPGLAQDRCVRDYEVLIQTLGGWQTIVECSGNYQRQRGHTVDPAVTTALRVKVLATNGDESARIYEVRVYGE